MQQLMGQQVDNQGEMETYVFWGFLGKEKETAK